MTWEVIFVDDGSTDATPNILAREALRDERVKLLRFSRNFGHQAAVTAGLDFANGDAVVVMDADLQDPPELLLRMLDLFEKGYDIVSPQRNSREGETRFKRWTAKMFYRALSRMADQPMTPDVGDFRLFSRRAVLAIRSLREQHRYMRGMVAWLGLKEAMLPFDRKARAAGKHKLPLAEDAAIRLDRRHFLLGISAAHQHCGRLRTECCWLSLSPASDVSGALDPYPCARMGLSRRHAMRLFGNDLVGAWRHRRLRR